MALTTGQVENARVEWVDQLTETTDLTKAQLRSTITALDAWLDANATAINQQFPAAARASLSPKQKAMFLAYTALHRGRNQ